jgi:hypothetical protein
LTSPPPITLKANSATSTTKAASATPTCIATPGHRSSPLAHQNAGALRAIARFSQLSIWRRLRSVKAATSSAIAKAISRP